jgi:hypothetical protein
MSMSLDGFVADPADGVAEVFSWFEGADAKGDTPVRMPDGSESSVRVSKAARSC